MPIETIEFKGETYPAFQASGFAARFAFPFANEVCKGKGVDVGCNRDGWKFPGAHPVDPTIHPEFNATNFPENEKDLDYIFSSHCLEHLDRWVEVMDYWYSRLRYGGILFLYLPHPDQEYWLPWNNRKHVSILHPEDIMQYIVAKGYRKAMQSEKDLNSSYITIAEK